MFLGPGPRLIFMTRTSCHISISVDGFLAGPDQARDDPIGIGGRKLHEWHWRAGEPGREADAGPHTTS